MELAGHMDLHPQDFQWIINRSNVEELTSPKSLALRFGSELLLELPYYPSFPESLPLGKKSFSKWTIRSTHCLYHWASPRKPARRGYFNDEQQG